MARKTRKKAGSRSMAAQADKYDLYQRSVQTPDCESAFYRRAYREAYSSLPVTLREDFCATAAICCDWVKKPGAQAIGVDIDPEVLDWCREHNFPTLKDEQRERVTLLKADASLVTPRKADVVSVGNFSICFLMTEEILLAYFKAAWANLNRQGLLVIDLLGGSEVLKEGIQEVHRKKGFTYIWEQERFNPIDNHCRFHIHYKFPDGSRMRRAFSYDWRLWSIPEVRRLMAQAGFKETRIYWEGTERGTNEGNGIYRRREVAESDLTWLAYIVAVK